MATSNTSYRDGDSQPRDDSFLELQAKFADVKAFIGAARVLEVIPEDHLVRLEGETSPVSFSPAMRDDGTRAPFIGKLYNKSEQTYGHNELLNTPVSGGKEFVQVRRGSYLQSR